LDREALLALSRGDQVEYERLRGEQQKLGRFCPLMTHSVYEGSPSIVFHPQLLQDYVTVDEYGWTLLEEEYGRGAADKVAVKLQTAWLFTTPRTLSADSAT
jgi:hypothetical protein